MGKISRRKKFSQKSQEQLNSGGTRIDEFSKLFDANKELDSDIVSVRSFKSSKIKLGIKKQLTKVDKMKFRKGLLKKKMNIQKNFNGLKLESEIGSQSTSTKLDLSSFEFFDKPDSTNGNKATKNKKPLAKRKKRRTDFAKDVDHLKKLMSAKLKVIKKVYKQKDILTLY